MKFLVLGLSICLSLVVRADYRPTDAQSGDHRVEMLERRVNQLQERMYRVEQRLGLNGGDQPQPVPTEAVCMLVGSYTKAAYLGKGANKLDAEYEARKSCQTKDAYGSAAGCSATVVCEVSEPYATSKTCLVTGSYTKNTYRGTGKTKLEATYAARLECQQKDAYGTAGGCAASPVCSE